MVCWIHEFVLDFLFTHDDNDIYDNDRINYRRILNDKQSRAQWYLILFYFHTQHRCKQQFRIKYLHLRDATWNY